MSNIVQFSCSQKNSTVELPNNRWLPDLIENIRIMMRTNPDAVQAIIDKAIDDHVSSLAALTPKNADKYRQLQWRVKSAIRHYKDPVVRMNKMMELFYDGVRALGSLDRNASLGLLV